VVVGIAIVAGAIGWIAAGGIFETSALGTPGTSPGGTGSPGGSGGPVGSELPSGQPPATAEPSPTPRPPIGGTELYGYLPYWQMGDSMAAYLGRTPVDTLALFSVSAGSNGALRTRQTGYVRITGERGRAIIAAAHARGQRIELVFTSFGSALNTRLFGPSAAAQKSRARAARELLALARDLGVDGINVDVERIAIGAIGGYQAFLDDLRAGLKVLGRKASLSVATTGGHGGALFALAAVGAGADRVFLMGYDYHWSGSSAGASSPVRNRDTGIDLSWSIAEYVNAGVPRDRIVLGLPLYGMSWPVAGPDREAPVTGKGSVWIPSSHADMLLGNDFEPTFDEVEIADYFVVPDGDAWRATYYDSPRTLRVKLGLARDQGLAGVGFWALGYERGLPGYLELMRDFAAGRIGG
jgi:hypothetical protein